MRGPRRCGPSPRAAAMPLAGSRRRRRRHCCRRHGCRCLGRRVDKAMLPPPRDELLGSAALLKRRGRQRLRSSASRFSGRQRKIRTAAIHQSDRGLSGALSCLLRWAAASMAACRRLICAFGSMMRLLKLEAWHAKPL